MFIRKASKNLILSCLIFSLFLFPIKPIHAQELSLSAESAILMDVTSGRILFEKSANKRMRIASLTKIMTAIVALESGNLKDIVKTSDNAYGTEGSSIYLKRGEEMVLEDMLYGLMLRSGNDAAVAIAEHIGGSIEGFRYLMNEKAAYVGMNGSHFMNPHGLDHKSHYSTSKDMAILTSYALKNEKFKEIVSTKVKTAPLADEPWDRQWVNKNKMLRMYEWADGVKTGYTKLAKRCLASSATKDGHQLVAITLNAPDDWSDHMRMFNYGFDRFKAVKLVKQNEYLGKLDNDPDLQLEIVAAEEFVYPLREGEKGEIKKRIVMLNKQNEQLEERETVGKLQFFFHDQYIGSVPIKLKQEKQTFKEEVIGVFKTLWKGE